jgi:diguanylate cyclase (GGDEF)-like protein/PAS domain S-box-containing protein
MARPGVSDDGTTEQLLQFIYAVPVGLILTDPDGRVRNMNPTANSILASLARGVPPQNIYEALAPAISDLRQRIQSHDGVGIAVDNIDFAVPGRAENRTYALSVHVLFDKDLAFVLSDVTERVRQRFEIFRRERQLRSIVDTVHNHMIVLLDEQLRIQEYNRSIQRLTGCGEDVVGQPVSVLFRDELDLPALRAAAERAGWAEIDGKMVSADESESWWGESVLSRIPDKGSSTLGFALVTREATDRRRREMELRQEADHDVLTGLYNRRFFDATFARAVEDACEKEAALSLCILDIDHFKGVNDNYGHPVGDVALRAISTRLGTALRSNDVLARVGGEEFAIILPNTPESDALHIAERCRRIIEADPVKASDALEVHLTISIGVTSLNAGNGSASKLFAEADEALYEAKNSGRNCVKMARGHTDVPRVFVP